MTHDPLLAQLADLAGILPEYVDIWAVTHATSDETRRALLGAMGISCQNDTALKSSLLAWHHRIWHQRLPSTHVVACGAHNHLTLRLAERVADQEFNWRIVLESGADLDGRFVPSALHRLASTDLDGEPWQAYDLELPAIEESGYHRLELSIAGETAATTLIVHPPQCFQPEAIRGDQRVWGISVQLYGVRSSRNWGMGDFTDLRHLVEWSARSGAGIVGVNPLHALFPDNPRHASPYSPSSRQFANVLYLDVEAVPDFATCGEALELVGSAEFQARLRALRATPLVDYKEVAQAKLTVLNRLHQHFREQHLARNTPRAQAFRDYVGHGGDDLARFALYHALQSHFLEQDPGLWGWPVWPAPYRDPGAAEVAAFSRQHHDRVEFVQYLQWLADEQLGSVGWRSMELGLGVGLYQDLAVGVDIGGAETWVHRDLYALDARTGCPPDEFNPLGQDWGLPPWIPHRLQEAGYAPFIAMLRANMRYAGALRLDHVMGLMRLFWVPPGMQGDQGAYVAYAFHDLLGILALESHRNQCLVIGEDLGTVPEAVQHAMHAMGVLSYLVLYLARDAEGGFPAPSAYPDQALIAASTHDLPTLTGFWRGTDLDIRTALNLYPDEARRAAHIVGRAEDRARLLMALEGQGVLPEGLSVHPVNVPDMSPALIRAIHRYLAASRTRIALVQAEDMLGELEQANLPGTVNQHPNWQRKLSLNLEEWADEPRITAMSEAMVAERGSAVHPHESIPFPLHTVKAPRATYRLQLSRDFTFQDATTLVPYLAELGISHCYCSPYLKARPGSTHGYDIIDHASLNPDIGGMEDLETFAKVLQTHGMGHILDMVPNHMGVMGSDNGWWLDVLENGEASAFANHFDIDWRPLKPSMQGKVLIPVLGDHYGNVLEKGELRLAFDPETGELSIWYYEHRFPVDPGEYPRILSLRIDELGDRIGHDNPLFLEYQSLSTGFSHLPSRGALEVGQQAERQRDKEIHKRHLTDLHQRSPDVQQFIAENLALFNGRPGEPASFDALHELLSAQAYRLAYWRVASDEINYRRFFDINDLAALRMENDAVFQATHALVFQLLQCGLLHGLRIDHSDGLLAPATYFEHLQHLYREASPTAGDSLYVVVEKILAPHERLRTDWAVSGTTGYDFSNLVNGLFIDGAAAEAITHAYRLFTRDHQAFEEIAYDAKRTIMKTALSSELNVLANRLSRIAEQDRHTRDYTVNSLRTTLMEVVACFPVYRTYLCHGQGSDEDRRQVEWACAVAKKRAEIADTSIYDFVRDVLLGDIAEGKGERYREAVHDFAMRFQQFSSPVMAKGLEDTAFYRYFPLASINEVGGEPRRFGVSVAAFHRANQERARCHPHTLLAGSTHDNKRAEDVRARINVLSELPQLWRRLLTRWHRINRVRCGIADGSQVPSRQHEYLFYQTLVGTWPDIETGIEPGSRLFSTYVQRITDYMTKAVREGKQQSAWINPNREYEGQLQRFIAAVLDSETGKRFLGEFAPFAREIAHFGRLNSLAQTVLRLTAPGVPDLYQGTELWDYSLVDPDNRRPVDYAARTGLLQTLREEESRKGSNALANTLLAYLPDGRIKLYVIWKLLHLRQAHPDLFEHGSYQPLTVEGSQAAHVCAFSRHHAGASLIVIVPRLIYSLLDGRPELPIDQAVWHDTAALLPMPQERLKHLFTAEVLMPVTRLDGERIISLGSVLARFPVAVLHTLPPEKATT